MFLKLFRHEMKACARSGLWLIIAILCAGAVLGVDIFLITEGIQNPDGDFSSIGMISGMTGLALSIMLLSGSLVLLMVLLFMRFYKTMVTDEAYLTLTLPVSVDSLLLSKLLTGMLWIFFGCLALVGAIGIALGMQLLFCPDIWLDEIWPELIEGLKIALEELFGNSFSYAVLYIVTTLVQSVETFLMVYVSILVGACLARKHKLLAAIGSAIAINGGKNIIMSVITFFMGSIYYLGEYSSLEGLYTVYLWPNLVLYLAFGVTEYLICRWLVSKKVNLE